MFVERKLKVLVAARRGLANVLMNLLEEVGIEAEPVADPAEALARLRAVAGVDGLIVLLDYEMPGLSGTRGTQLARSLLGERPLGLVCSLAGPGTARRMLSAGATAVLPAGLTAEALRASLGLLAIRQRCVIVGHDVATVPFDAAASLTERELQVLCGICDGLQNKEIAHRFGIREVTVKMHVRAIVRKLGARNRTHAAMIARDMEIV
ncbi:MAG: DNA-binding response regulator [Rhodobacterales bacterium]|nr:MAG: DNA-binding response regulator [Rhodobacterales bacterium]